jgi:hypothetical protein
MGLERLERERGLEQRRDVCHCTCQWHTAKFGPSSRDMCLVSVQFSTAPLQGTSPAIFLPGLSTSAWKPNLTWAARISLLAEAWQRCVRQEMQIYRQFRRHNPPKQWSDLFAILFVNGVNKRTASIPLNLAVSSLGYFRRLLLVTLRRLILSQFFPSKELQTPLPFTSLEAMARERPI